MPDKPQQKHRTNRVFKSLHKPLTYLGVERTLFYFVCVGAVGAFNLFNSILAGIAVFIGGFSFGHWVTNSDPAFLRILAKSERYPGDTVQYIRGSRQLGLERNTYATVVATDPANNLVTRCQSGWPTCGLRSAALARSECLHQLSVRVLHR